MAFESERWPGEIHLYAASLEDSSDFTAQAHTHVAEAVPWIELSDKLSRYPHAGS